jgi:hypothetical protein
MIQYLKHIANQSLSQVRGPVVTINTDHDMVLIDCHSRSILSRRKLMEADLMMWAYLQSMEFIQQRNKV